MARHLAGRLGQALIVLWLAYTITFFAIELLPSDPISVYLTQISEGTTIDPNLVESMKSYYGYNQPLGARYLHQLGELAQGNFGYSLNAARPVIERIGEVLGPTLSLALSAFAMALFLASATVVTAVLAPWASVRRAARGVPALFSAMPTFWLGIVALQVLSFRLGLMSIFPDGSLLAFVVPAIVLGIPLSAPFTQVLLKSVDATYAQPFVDVARAKGGRPGHVFFQHVTRNAAAPALTMVGLAAGQLLAGTVVTETVFSRTGIGKVLEEAVSRQDVALVQGFVLLSALVFVVINLTVDLVYPLLDPRIAGIRRRRTGASHAPVVPAVD